MEVYTDQQTGFKRVVGNCGSSGGFPTLTEALLDYKRVKRNYFKREQNQILRDITGTSAASARKDMCL